MEYSHFLPTPNCGAYDHTQLLINKLTDHFGKVSPAVNNGNIGKDSLHSAISQMIFNASSKIKQPSVVEPPFQPQQQQVQIPINFFEFDPSFYTENSSAPSSPMSFYSSSDDETLYRDFNETEIALSILSKELGYDSVSDSSATTAPVTLLPPLISQIPSNLFNLNQQTQPQTQTQVQVQTSTQTQNVIQNQNQPQTQQTQGMASFASDLVVDFKHLIYNLLVDNYNNSQNNFCIPISVEIMPGVFKQGFQFNAEQQADKRLAEFYAQHIRKANLQLENQDSVFIQDLYKFYLRACVELLSKYFIKQDKYTYLYDDIPLFVAGGNLEDAEFRISKLGTIQRKKTGGVSNANNNSGTRKSRKHSRDSDTPSPTNKRSKSKSTSP